MSIPPHIPEFFQCCFPLLPQDFLYEPRRLTILFHKAENVTTSSFSMIPLIPKSIFSWCLLRRSAPIIIPLKGSDPTTSSWVKTELNQTSTICLYLLLIETFLWCLWPPTTLGYYGDPSCSWYADKCWHLLPCLLRLRTSVALSKTHGHSPSGKVGFLTVKETFAWTCVGLVERRGPSTIDAPRWHLASRDFLLDPLLVVCPVVESIIVVFPVVY